MDSKISCCLSRLSLVLKNSLCCKCEIKDLDKLIDLLQQQQQKEMASFRMCVPILTDWTKQAVDMWNLAEMTAGENAVSFLFDLASLLTRNEEDFLTLNGDNLLIKLISACKIQQEETHSAYVNFLSTFLNHKTGTHWIIRFSVWVETLQFQCPEATTFIVKLLQRTIDVDRVFCRSAVKRIIAGSSSLPLAERILERCLADSLHGQDLRIPLIFLENFYLNDLAPADLMRFAKILFMMQFLELYFKVASGSISFAETSSQVERIKRNFVLAVSKIDEEELIEFCNFAHMFWRLFDKIPHSDEKRCKTFTFGTQFLYLQFLFNFSFVYRRSLKLSEVREFVEEDCRDLFVTNALKTVEQSILRISFRLRNSDVNLHQYSIKTLLCLKEALAFFSKDVAILVLQALIYNSKDFINLWRKAAGRFTLKETDFSYFAEVFKLLIVVIERFAITWKDSFEAVDIMTIAFDFLSLPEKTPDVVVQALRLMNVAAGLCLSPSMALLVDAEDSTVDLMAPLLYLKTLDEDLEVRKAAVEAIRTLASMSVKKFPSLQKVLMDSELPTLVVKMSSCDSESFVRATAIKCLQEMIQVEEIWNNALKSEDLPQKMHEILLNETEGIVRVEAATFMCVAYEQQQFHKDSLNKLYEIMIYSSTTDLHWEVKVRALSFWDKVIKNHLQNQGMIDGSFPNVTFSKEHRKIVTLTDSEIRKRLLKVLQQLSTIGCLGVLTGAIKDDCDMEVSKAAVKITQRLVDLFKKYNLSGDGSAPTSPQPTENGRSSLSSGISVDESMDSPNEMNEEIIEQIVNAKDANLLRGVYSPSDYGSVSNFDVQVRKIVSPGEFLVFTRQDLNGIIAEKKKWLNGIDDLGSLLDDMLKTYDEDVNNMDCY